MSASRKVSRIKVTEDEHRLIQRYREQARAYNEGIADAIRVVMAWDITKNVDLDEMEEAIAKLRKETI